MEERVITREYEKKMSEISPFELKDILIDLADESARKSTHIMLNAGRGNPNWIATTPREAFFLLGQFGMEECRRGTKLEDGMVGLAGVPEKKRIAVRFKEFLDKHEETPGSRLLRDTYEYMVREKGVDENDLVHEWAEGVIGDQYPVPDRILKYTEVLVEDYLKLALCNNHPPKGKFDLFATEGGTAAMCYIFDSLQQNFLLNKGDKIVLFAPVFTPYIEIPEQARYLFDVIEIHALKMTGDGYHTWQYQEKDLDVLKDPSVKAAFIVNPSNPPSYALTEGLTECIVDIVTNFNPNLMIITDDVYATFVPGFRSLISVLPDNTLCVYSFSKYFGATGWRLAVVALHEDNIYDRMIADLPDDKKAALNKRYDSIMIDPSKMKLIDRMVADSRQVALNHTAGLSLPQQTQMALFSAFSLLDAENLYQSRMIEIIHERLHTLWESTGFTLLDDPLRAGYYSEIDMEVWAKKFYGDEFVEYLKANYEPVDVVFRLAQETALVLLNGGGFDAPEWSIRASLANLKTEDYVRIGEGIASILHSYAEKWKESEGNKNNH
ncbi:bifunctional aspartate transaminase/aspartate 4-decarboxylase [uncultured Parabacteroides sp.]|uniref:bifunctional aspartate transaminase/aspartate 4-decarboxylase n=1 Tax=uncultured Parabacteroides sp. TaxID=512312 RepID=UPI0025D01EF6|nr:bifunctional aspartate transaminase/aspartate 4-decarboxylase [uncultured Parabacteroides sp.]